MRTWNAKENEVERKWWIIDATDKSLGRMATEIANILRGKNKAEFTPHMDTGDFVVVINSEKVRLTGKKEIEKTYYWHSRFFGGLRSKSAEQIRQQDPAYMVTEAVKGMLPKNKLSRSLLNKLKAYEGAEHPHAAQKPQPYTLK